MRIAPLLLCGTLLPALAAATVAGSQSDLVCRYLWDVERKKPAYCGQSQSSDAYKDFAEMASIEPFARERQAEVQSLAARIAEVGEAQCGEIFHRISEAKLAKPLNERTFHAWLPEDKGAQTKIENCLKRLGETNRALNEKLGQAGGDSKRAAEIRRRLGQVESVLAAFGGRVVTAENFKAYTEGSKLPAAGAAEPGAGAVLASAGGARIEDVRPVKPRNKSSDLSRAVPAEGPSAVSGAGRAKPDWKVHMSPSVYSTRDRRDAEIVVEAVSRRMEDYHRVNRDALGDRLSGFPLAGTFTHAKRWVQSWVRSSGPAMDLRGSAEHQRQALAAAREALPKGSNLEVKAVDVGLFFRHHAVVIYPKGIDPLDPKNTDKILVVDPYLSQGATPDDIVFFKYGWERHPSVYPASRWEYHE